MNIVAQLKGIFTPQSVAVAMENLVKLKSTFRDLLFPQSKQHPFPGIGIKDLTAVLGTLPLTKRGGPPVPILVPGEEGGLFVPQPLMPSLTITAAELKDLSLIFGSQQNQRQYVAGRAEIIRQLIHNTTEGMCVAMATTGKMSWPTRLGAGGFDVFECDFGAIHTLNPAALWDMEADLGVLAVFDFFCAMEQTLEESGGGGNMAVMAGKKAYGVLFRLVSGWVSTIAKPPVELAVDGKSIKIGGYEIKRMAERYIHPVTGAWVDKLDPQALLGYSQDVPGTVWHLAVDVLNSSDAVYLDIYPKEIDNRGLELIGQAKPLPVRSPKSLVLSHVTRP